MRVGEISVGFVYLPSDIEYAEKFVYESDKALGLVILSSTQQTIY